MKKIILCILVLIVVFSAGCQAKNVDLTDEDWVKYSWESHDISFTIPKGYLVDSYSQTLNGFKVDRLIIHNDFLTDDLSGDIEVRFFHDQSFAEWHDFLEERDTLNQGQAVYYEVYEESHSNIVMYVIDYPLFGAPERPLFYFEQEGSLFEITIWNIEEYSAFLEGIELE